MPKALRVLIVDDMPDDAQLMLTKIRQAGYEPTYKLVDTEEDLMSATIAEKWDVVLCDYSMPFMTAEQSLSWIKQTCPGTPFILISGYVDEQLASGVLKKGAIAYVDKNKMDKLVPTIEQAIQKAALKKSGPSK